MMVAPLGRGFILKGTPELASALPPREDVVRRHWDEPGRASPSEHDHAGALALDFPASRTVRNMSVVYHPPVSGGLLQQPERTERGV